jgi:hypothetical protein
MRHSELMTIQKRLGRLCARQREPRRWKRNLEWDRIFGGLALLLAGVFLAGLLGLIPFLATDPSHVARREYIGLVVITGIATLIAAVARMAIKEQQEESVLGIYEYVTDIINTYTSGTGTQA